MIDEEVGKYRKKSTARGLPRSKHKHEYRTVLVVERFELPDIHTGKQVQHESKLPKKVCTICGRINGTDTDEKWYNRTKQNHLKWTYFIKELSQDALELPVWICNEHFGKFATPVEDNDE